ncbi:MAG: type IV pili methyl-accepting chemotaxis transducer N-terminal domain-containing protein [Pseudomonadota bacterium]
MPGLETINPRRMWRIYVSALLSIFILVSASHFAGAIIGGDAERMAEDINTSGRQRMLSQRILFFAASYQTSGYADEQREEGLRAALTLFKSSHEALTRPASGRLSPALADIYFGTGPGQGLDAAVQAFVADAIAVLAAPLAEKEAALDRMKLAGAGALLTDLNRAVSLYEGLAKSNARMVEQVALAGYILAIVTLFLEALFIFLPSHRAVVAAFDEVEAANRQLEEREADAFAALEEAEEAWAEAEDARVTSETAQRRIGDLVANIRTELALPLAALLTIAERLSMTRLPDAALGDARSVTAIADVSARTLDDLVAFSDPSAAPPTGGAANLNAILKRAAEIVSAAGRGDRPAVAFDLDDAARTTLDVCPVAIFRLALFTIEAGVAAGAAAGRDAPVTVHLRQTPGPEGVDVEFQVAAPGTPLATDDPQTLIGLRVLSEDPVRADILAGLVARIDGQVVTHRAPPDLRFHLSFRAQPVRAQTRRGQARAKSGAGPRTATG